MEFDYVIVGAGSAGCVLANRLSEDASVTVALIEAGGRDWYPWIHIPVGYFKTMHHPKYDWRYKTEADPGLNGRRLEWPRGKVLGGSSAINGLLYVRGQPQDYDHWRQLGNTGWSYEDVLPYFKKSERQERGGDEFHGGDGPLCVSDMRVHRGFCDAFIDAAEANGIPRRDDFNGAIQEGAGYFQLTAKGGWRQSTATAFLKPARRRPNLKVFTNGHTLRVLFDGSRAAGIDARFGARDQTLFARREVILSAGAIGSPQLLQLSGVGDGRHLSDFGITTRFDLPGVGKNLQDHLQLRSTYKSSVPTLNNDVNSLTGRLKIGLDFILRRRGPMTMGASQVGIFARTDHALETPDIQFHIQPLSSDSPGHGLHPFAAFTASVCQLRPESRGSVLIKSPNAEDAPAIRPNYLATANDQETAVKGIKLCRQISRTPPLSKIIEAELEPGDGIESDQQLFQWARNTATTVYHPAGTCKMGQDRDAVVDDRLRVRGTDGLRVVDASIMPTLVSGNTNAPTIMIAEKAADMIRQDARL